MSERTWQINDKNRYFNTAENGQRFYIDRNNINGNATWDAEKGLTTTEWDALHTVQKDVQKTRSNQNPIGGHSLPPTNLPIASSPSKEPPKRLTYAVMLEEKGGKFTVKNTQEIASPAARSRKTRARKSRSRKTRSRRH